MTDPSRTIVIYGGGFAAHLVTAACARSLGGAARLILIAPDEGGRDDVLYGNASAPTAYDFFRSVGLDEPTLMMQTGSAFSYGTRFTDWPGAPSSWMQAYHLPLPVLFGVPFQHFLTAEKEKLEPYLVSAQAALRGVFAHPPEEPKNPLSRAEYGYQFSISDLTQALIRLNDQREVTILETSVREVHTSGGQIASLELEDGQQVEADLFVDCSGADRRLIRALDVAFHVERTLCAAQETQSAGQLGPPHRTIAATQHGWSASTPLQTSVETLTITHPDSASAERGAAHTFETGTLERAWTGNCVAVGHAAWGMEPLTAAPIILLQRDVERLLDLIPLSRESTVEAREYNRRFEDDLAHANAFQRALFATDALPSTPYWQAAAAVPPGEKLERKLAQFRSRGIFVRFDLEPFNEEDWAILHNGMGLTPERYDRQVDSVEADALARQLTGIKQAVAQIVSKMPPHHVYMSNMKRYLEKQKHG